MFDESSPRHRAWGFSLDLWLVIATTVAVWGFVLFDATSNPLQVVAGALFVVFLPGYAFVAVLFPSRSTGSSNSLSRIALHRERPNTITATERIVFSLGTSVVLVPFLGVVAHFSGWGVTAETVVALVGALTVGLSLAAMAVRLRLPRDQRFGIASVAPLRRVYAWVFGADDGREAALGAFIVAGLLLAAVGIGGAAVLTPNGEQYTELYLLNEGANGTVADDYQTDLGPGDTGTAVLGVTNQEGQRRTYTVVEQVQRTDGTGAGASVVETDETDRFELTVERGETVERSVTFERTLRGGDVRVAYLLYVGEPPADPDVDSAYRTTHLWIDADE